MNLWTEAGARTHGNALHVGAAALWDEKRQKESGWQVWGQTQLGVENTDMRRAVAFEGYERHNSSSGTSFNAMAQLGGGYLWRMEGGFAFGPRVGLEYALNALPAMEEDNGGGTRLTVEDTTWHDLRGTAGIMTTWRKDLDKGRFVRADLEAAWRQDLLPGSRTVRAQFRDTSHASFESRLQRKGRGSLGLTGGIEAGLREDVTLSAQIEADVLRPGYNSVGGALALRWLF